MSFGIPTIGAIQRTNVILVAIAVLTLAWLGRDHSALGCLLGGSVVIANLYLLTVIGRVVIAAVTGGSSLATRLGHVAIPLKLMIMLGLLYLVFTNVHVDALGFALGVLTQFVGIIIETGRAALRRRPDFAEKSLVEAD
jgi:ATP synthase I chain